MLARTAVSTLRCARSAAVRSCSASAPDVSKPKVVVVGGNGFVGTAVCEQALSSGMSVVAINRSGAPAAGTGEWGAKVEWVKADVFDKDAWSHHCEGATAVISSVGTFGSNATMEKVCGDANIAAVEAAAAAGVDRFVFVSNSAVGTDLPDFLLHGYFNGKLRAECLEAHWFMSLDDARAKMEA